MKANNLNEHSINILKNHLSECGCDFLFYENEKELLNHKVIDSHDGCVNIEALSKKR